MISVRRLEERDLPSLAELYRQFWNDASSTEAMRRTFRGLRDDPDYLFLVADDSDEANGSAIVAGTVLGIVCHNLYGECRPFLTVEDVIVDREYRRRGVGSALMRELERIARERGCYYIILVTDTDRTAARSFYESLGYDPESHKGYKKRL